MVDFSKPSIDLHKPLARLLFWLTDLHEGKKRGNVALQSISDNFSR